MLEKYGDGNHCTRFFKVGVQIYLERHGSNLGASLRNFSCQGFIEPTKFLHTLYLKHWYNVQNLQNLLLCSNERGWRGD